MNPVNEIVENVEIVEAEIVEAEIIAFIPLRVCTSCGSSTNKFKAKGRKCIKCYSKTNNEKFKEKDYFKHYYINHKPVKPPKEPVPIDVPIPEVEPNYDIFPAV